MHGPWEETDNGSAVGAEVRGSEIRRVALAVPGLCCCNGADHVSRALETMQGVCDCEIDVLTRSVHVGYEGARCAVVDLIATVQRVGYQVDDVQTAGVDGSTQ